ncbi:MFS transporter [Gluconacetobacter asukensis]|uniref:MFS transporter n=1 Tax=Gluconacetobacter asukensis TaxID=1017181 RepID=A0A7W4P066_9PROT|nr:MFS transporter [Gluconacetobacter asukensis]MBB2172349.1 MFS transporter [Gluconacetobacter asukensis]
MKPAKRALCSAMAGNIVEWYDFSLYLAAAPLIFSQLFFSGAQTAFMHQVEAAAFFAAGFVVRPVGGILFGYLGDRYGHLVSLRWTLLLIGAGTAAIGALPGFDTIGLYAPSILLLLRLVQGVAAGGEWAGSILVIEGAAAGARNNTVLLSLSQSGVAAGMVLGTVALWLASCLPHEAFLRWGWRAAFVAPLPFVGLGILLRTSMDGGARRVEPHGLSRFPLVTLLRREPVAVLRGIGIRLAENGGVYLMTVFGLSYGREQHIPDTVLLLAMTLGLAADGLAMPLFGWLAVRYGAQRVYLGGIIGLSCLAPLFFLLVASGQTGYVMLAFVLVMALGHAPMIAVEPILLARLFADGERYTGVAVSHEIGAVLAGGLSPLMATLLYHASGSVNGVILYLLLLATFSAIALCGRGIGRDKPASFS